MSVRLSLLIKLSLQFSQEVRFPEGLYWSHTLKVSDLDLNTMSQGFHKELLP